MFTSIKKFFGFSDSAAPEVTPLSTPSAPYKVPEPAAITPIPLVVEAAIEPVAPVAPVAKPKAPAKPKAVKKPAAPAVPKAPKAPKISAK
jgi:hypothetical protein